MLAISTHKEKRLMLRSPQSKCFSLMRVLSFASRHDCYIQLCLGFMSVFVYLHDAKFFFTKAPADVLHDIRAVGIYSLTLYFWKGQPEILKKLWAFVDYPMSYFSFPAEVLPTESRGQKGPPPDCQYPCRRAISARYWSECNLRLRWWAWHRGSALATCHHFWDLVIHREDWLHKGISMELMTGTKHGRIPCLIVLSITNKANKNTFYESHSNWTFDTDFMFKMFWHSEYVFIYLQHEPN